MSETEGRALSRMSVKRKMDGGFEEVTVVEEVEAVRRWKTVGITKIKPTKRSDVG